MTEKPTQPDEFAQFCQDATKEEIAERYEEERKLSREQVDETKDARDYYIARCYDMFAHVSVSEIADAFGVSESTVSTAVSNDPVAEQRGKPDVFKDM